MPDVSIIIINYKSYHLLRNCIKSIHQNTLMCDYEIIVVDNNSDNDCSEKLRSEFGENLNCIQLDTNIGFGRANNCGLKIARGRNILYLNPDTILLNDAISQLSYFLDNHNDIGAVGGNLLDSNLKPTRSYRRRFPDNLWLLDNLILANYGERMLFKNSLYYNSTNKPIEVAYIVGADLMVKKSVLDKTGPFNPTFFMYYEEIELCYRIKKQRYKIINVPTAIIQHLEGKSTSNISFRSKEMAKSITSYFFLTKSKVSYLFSRILYFLLIIERYILSLLTNEKTKIIYWRIQLSHFKYKI